MGPAASSSRWRAAAGDLLLGSSCHGCGAAAWTLCDDCRHDLAAQVARPARPEPCPASFPATWTAGSYDDLARGLVSAHKERAALGLSRVLGERLALAVQHVSRSRNLSAQTVLSAIKNDWTIERYHELLALRTTRDGTLSQADV